MYDMYPDWSGTEWGPAKHDPEHPLHRDAMGPSEALQTAFERRGTAGFARRDADAFRPDDN